MPEKFKNKESEEDLSQYPEQNEQEKGRNVKVSAIFERHGQKESSQTTAETELTETGEKDSAEFGRSLPERGVVKGYSSDTPRTMKTAELAVENSPTKVKAPKIRIDRGLGFYYDPKGDFFKNVRSVGEDASDITECRNLQADYYLKFGDKRPDPRTISPVELAALIAKKVNTYINMADKLDSGSDVQLINATHDFNIAAFLKEVMVLSKKEEGEPVKFEKIEEIGGGIGYNESFEVLAETDSHSNKTVKLIFRGKEYELDTKRLAELIEIAKKFDFKSVEKTEK